MPFVLAVIDLLKSVAWPIVVLIVAVFYKREIIKDLLPRLRKAGPSGIEFDAAEQQKKIGTDIVAASSELKPKLDLGAPTPAIAQVENKLFDELQKIDIENRTQVLIRELAVARLVAAFERIYRALFGSQILGLRRLNESYRVTVDDARTFFENFRAQTPDTYPLTFDVWLGFLKNQELLQETDGMLEITEIGRDFLIYVTKNRLPENKPY